MDRRRVVLFVVLLLLPLGGLEARLAWIQVLNRDAYATAPRRHSLELAGTPRARIVDRAGRVMARDELGFEIWVVLDEFERRPETKPELGLPGLDEQIEKIYGRIERLMNARPERERWRIFQRERQTPYLLAKSLPRGLAMRIETDRGRFPGCQARETLRRVYPLGPVGALVVGTLGRATREEAERLLRDGGFEEFADEDALQLLLRRGAFDEEMVGRSGVERFCQDRLRGRPGLLVHERDPQTGLASWIDIVPPRPGDDVELTLDAEFQKDVEDILATVPTRATAVVMEPSTGEIRALATNVPFDPNRITPADLDLRGPQPLLSRATAERHQVGSIFKIVTAIAALEGGRASRDRVIECRGSFLANANHTRCWTVRRQLPPHGPLTLAGALERSCNCYFYQLGHDLGLEPISTWAERLGFGRKMDIELPETAGQLPRPSTHARWTPTQTYGLAIGQGDLMASPAQVARLMAAVANGGVLVRPHLVRGRGLNEPLGISKQTLDAVREGLHAVVHAEHGTAHASGLAKFGASGKTSSAQTREGEESHAWFGGYTDKAAIVVLVEHGGAGGAAAAPVAARILERMK